MEYLSLLAAYPSDEPYVPPVTLALPDWASYVASGQNTLYGDAVVPGDTTMGGAVYTGHMRQNPFTAMIPYRRRRPPPSYP
jgi:hypothetical protein